MLVDRRIAVAWAQLDLLPDSKDSWRHAVQYSMLVAPVRESHGTSEFSAEVTILCIE